MTDHADSPEAEIVEGNKVPGAQEVGDDIVDRITTDCGVVALRCGRDGRIVYINRAAGEVFGAPRHSFLGKKLVDVMPSNPNNQSGCSEALQQVLVDATSAEYRFAISSADSQRDYLVMLSPAMRENGEVGHAHVVAVDISCQRQKVRQARESDQQKERFLAFVAHEMRNPLSSISSGVRMLERQQLVPNASEVLQMMDRQIGYLTRLVSDLLDVARNNNGSVMISKDLVAIGDVVALALEISRCAIDNKQHTLLVSIPEEPIELRGDLQRLSQVVINLIDNAAKYTPSGGEIRLVVSQELGEVEIAVSDNGIGISQGQAPYVFDMFRQVHHEDGYRKGGLGIGLYLVKLIVEAHQGSVSVHSDGPGRGSRFTVRIPC